MGTLRELSSLKTGIRSCFEEVGNFPLLFSLRFQSNGLGKQMWAAGAEVATSAKPEPCSEQRSFLFAKLLGPFQAWTGFREKLFSESLGKANSSGISKACQGFAPLHKLCVS